jgi:hypothetical protein
MRTRGVSSGPVPGGAGVYKISSVVLVDLASIRMVRGRGALVLLTG